MSGIDRLHVHDDQADRVLMNNRSRKISGDNSAERASIHTGSEGPETLNEAEDRPIARTH